MGFDKLPLTLLFSSVIDYSNCVTGSLSQGGVSKGLSGLFSWRIPNLPLLKKTTSLMDVRSLLPQPVWNHFADLNAIPRASKHEAAVSRFMKAFGEGLGLETIQDAVGNVIIRKAATPGMEGRQTVALQGHIDMVQQKNADVDFDFATEGIRMYVDGDWVKAKGTTLGADNGLGVAAIMAVLSSDDIPHPPLEALFTIDEETGMTGAKELEPGILKARMMLNLDTEEDDSLTIGCAGGVDVTGSGKYETEAPDSDVQGYRLFISGLKGGHSGGDIHLGRANANKLMNRLLSQAAEKFGLRVAAVDGGGLRNAIPRESSAIVAVPAGNASAFETFLAEETGALQKEYAVTDPELKVEATGIPAPERVWASDFQDRMLRVIYTLHNGIFRMSPDIAGLVQTSNNLARVRIGEGTFTVQCLTRSSVDSEKWDLARGLEAALQLSGADVTFTGDYPGWTPLPGSQVVQLASEVYENLFGEPAHVDAVHAGLECGIIGGKYPAMEMISFGPTIAGAHSPDEQAQISSTQKFWKFLQAVLAAVPE